MEKPFINPLSIFFLLGLSLPSEGSPAPAADLTAQWSASPGSPLQIVHSLKSPGYRHRFSKEEVKSEPLPLARISHYRRGFCPAVRRAFANDPK